MFYHGGSKNRGCEAIVRASIPIIKKYLPEAKISLASFDPASDDVIPGLEQVFDARGISLKKYSLPWLIGALNVKLFKNENYVYRKQFHKILDQIPNYDVFLSIGGDNYCYGEQPWLYEVDRQIKKAGKKLVLWGASIGAEDLSPTKIEDLKSFDLLLIRESISLQNLKQAGIPNVEACADPAFTMDKEELPLPDGWQEGNTIGFNYSPLVYKRNPQSVEAAKTLLGHILETTDAAVCLTPHVIIPGNDDYETLSHFYEHFKHTGRVILLPGTLNAIQYKGYIARMRYFIGARTHATIAAYSNFVPTMVLGYSVKSKGIAADLFGEPKLVLGIHDISDAEKLIAQFEDMRRQESDIKDHLKGRIPEIQKMSYQAGEQLARLMHH